jgi:hypothetical protein
MPGEDVQEFFVGGAAVVGEMGGDAFGVGGEGRCATEVPGPCGSRRRCSCDFGCSTAAGRRCSRRGRGRFGGPLASASRVRPWIEARVVAVEERLLVSRDAEQQGIGAVVGGEGQDDVAGGGGDFTEGFEQPQVEILFNWDWGRGGGFPTGRGRCRRPGSAGTPA